MLRILIVAAFILNFVEIANACGPFYTNIFNQPHYIDPENINSMDDSPNTQFHFILQSFSLKPTASTDNSDSEARIASQKTQPEQYFKYKAGVEKFFQSKYEDALKIFSEIKKSGSGWAREASTYMIARSHKNLAEKNWDGLWDDIANSMSSRSKMIDQAELKLARRSYEIYLEEYPRGLYAQSAHNINRHFLLLLGNQEEYNQAIKQALTNLVQPVDENLFNEYKNHYKGSINIEKDTPPLFIAYQLIHYSMADHSYLTTLESKKQDFINYPGLLPFLRALTLYRLKEYRLLLEETSSMDLTNTPLSLSLEFLRYRAEFKLNKNKEALASLLKMYALTPNDSSLEHHIVLLQTKTNQALWLFSNDNPIHDKAKLALFAQYSLSDSDLVKGLFLENIPQANRRILAEELAQRYLLSRDYIKLAALLRKYPKIEIYNIIKPDIFTLIKNGNDPSALLQLGKYIYDHYFFAGAKDLEDPFFGPEARLYEFFGRDELLENSFTERVKNYVPPIWYYKKALQLASTASTPNFTEARALSYLSKCPRFLENRQRCTWGKKIDYNPKPYFLLLHKKYENSKWAKETPYWYDPNESG